MMELSQLREIILLAPSNSMGADEAGFITRFIVGGLLLSHGARRDAVVTLIVDNSACVQFEGNSMRNVRPDEQSLSGILRAGLRRLNGRGRKRIMQGITTFSGSLEEIIERSKGEKIFYGGVGGRTVRLSQGFTAVFQYPDLGRQTDDLLQKNGFLQVRLGSKDLTPDQAVTILNNMADRSLA
jgi:tRNA pseudouridine-54 N-methylase